MIACSAESAQFLAKHVTDVIPGCFHGRRNSKMHTTKKVRLRCGTSALPELQVVQNDSLVQDSPALHLLSADLVAFYLFAERFAVDAQCFSRM